MLYENKGKLATDYEDIAWDLKISKEKVKKVVEFPDLFVVKNELFSSRSVNKRLRLRTKKSKATKEAALTRWHGKDYRSVPGMQTHSERNAINKRKEIKEKKEGVISENDLRKRGEMFKELVKHIADQTPNISESQVPKFIEYWRKPYPEENL